MENFTDALVNDNIIVAGEPLDLSKCRAIQTDVKDIRGEYETNYCILYSQTRDAEPILTRVQIRTLIIKEVDGRHFALGKQGRKTMHLPGGGYDGAKDNGDPCNTAKREAWEEFNYNLTNVKDLHLYSWKYRKDKWVEQHVKNDEDKWYGYLTILIVADYNGLSDNNRPDERGHWEWYPIEVFKKNDFYNQALSSLNLNEAIHANKPGRDDLGEISYLCDSLQTLRIILSTMEIQKTYVKEVRWKPQDAKRGYSSDNHKQYSLSTSTNLTGHAKRRPERWGFGVILDGHRLSQYYNLVPYNHAYYKLPDQYITKIVKLKDGRVILNISYYGNREVQNGEWLYDYIVDYIDTHPKYSEAARTLDDYVDSKNPSKWKYRWNLFKHDDRFANITPDEIEDLRSFSTNPISKNCLQLKRLDRLDDVLEHLAKYSNFNEEEERIWLEDELLNFVQIPQDTLVGVILPNYFKEDYDLNKPTNVYLAWIKQFVAQNNLKVIWHEYTHKIYKKELATGQAEDEEQRFNDLFKRLSPESIVDRAKDLVNKVSLKKYREILPKAQVATAIVKKAIKACMQDLTTENYDEKYKQAFDMIVDDAFDCKLSYDKSSLINNTSLKHLFNYYVPDPPAENN